MIPTLYYYNLYTYTLDIIVKRSMIQKNYKFLAESIKSTIYMRRYEIITYCYCITVRISVRSTVIVASIVYPRLGQKAKPVKSYAVFTTFRL